MDDTYNILRYFKLRKGISVVFFFSFVPSIIAFSSRFLLLYLCMLFVLLYIRTHVYVHTRIIMRVFYTFCWYFVSYFQEIVDQFCFLAKNTYLQFNKFFFRKYKLWNEYTLSSAVILFEHVQRRNEVYFHHYMYMCATTSCKNYR